MKIFFVSRGWPSVREPQWGNFECDQALALSKIGHQVVVLSVDARFRRYHRKYGITHEIHGDIPHYNLFAGSVWGKALRKISVNLHIRVRRFFFMRLFEKVIMQEGVPDLIYAHYLGSSSMALAAKQKYNIPVVGIEHWSELGYANIKSDVKLWAGKVYKNLDCLLTVSSALRENILKNFGMNSIVVNNMVGQEFRYVPAENNEGKVRFVTTGNLLPVKGFDNLIKAFDRLQLPTDTWSLNIIGSGKDYDSLQKLIDNLALGKNVFLCGRKSRDGVIGQLQNSDVYVMSSRSETFGVAAIEALACGLPVVATDCGGARDFLTERNGLLCKVNDVHSLSEAILHMYKTHRSYNRQKISEECLKRFSSEAIGKQLENIFEGIINKK